MVNKIKNFFKRFHRCKEKQVQSYKDEVDKEVDKTVKMILTKDTAYYIYRATRK